MQPEDIIRSLDRVLPEVRETGDPEGTLLKFAKRENLKLGQLEKLGQSFNIAKTLAHMKHSDNRGSSFSTLDVPGMMSKYATFTPVESQVQKAASSRKPSMEKAASHEEDYDPYSFHTDIYLASKGIEPQDLEKAGGYETEAVSEFEKIAEAMDIQVTRQLAEQHEYDCLEDAREAAEALSKQAKIQEVDTSALMADALGTVGDDIRPACNFLAKVASEMNLSIEVPEDLENRLYRDTTGLVPALEKVSNFMKLAQATREYVSKFASTETLEREKKKEQGGSKSPDPTSFSEKVKNPGSVSDYMFWEERPERYVSDGRQLIDGKSVQKGLAGMTRAIYEDPGTSSKYNKRQESRDEAHEEAIFLSNLQKLMIQDAVISEASDAAIVNAANSIREADPEIVRSPAEFRWLLREALQYDMEDGNIPQHLISELKKRQESTLKNRELKRKENKELYKTDAS
jgi:hypothetical protein